MENPDTKVCKECGAENSMLRLTCTKCHEPFFKKSKKTMPAEVKAKLKATSKERNGKKKRIEKRVKEIIEKPKKLTVSIYGEAEKGRTSIKIFKPSVDPNPAAKIRTCPCCGEETNRGSYFKIGHDARIIGKFILVSRGGEITLNDRLSRLYEAWTPEKFIKEIVKIVEG